MKTTLFLLSLMSLIHLNLAGAAEQGSLRQSKVQVPVKHVYVPNGFDDNDNTEIVVSGYLPNLCYYGPEATATVKNGKVYVDVSAYLSKSLECELTIVPFLLTVRLGVLKAGSYDIVVNGGLEAQNRSSLAIGAAFSNNVDEHLYANVDSVERVQGTRNLKLHGYHASDCYQLDKVMIASNEQDTYAVLPIMKKIRNFCPMKMTPFEIDVTVPETLSMDEVLIHVRSMRGSSVNYLFIQNN